MIKINGEIVTINKFPDGTPRVNIDTNNIEEDSYDCLLYTSPSPRDA